MQSTLYWHHFSIWIPLFTWNSCHISTYISLSNGCPYIKDCTVVVFIKRLSLMTVFPLGLIWGKPICAVWFFFKHELIRVLRIIMKIFYLQGLILWLSTAFIIKKNAAVIFVTIFGVWLSCFPHHVISNLLWRPFTWKCYC